MRKRPRIYFSFRSPYSWMAIEQVRRRVPRMAALVDFCPSWEPCAEIRQAMTERAAEVLYTPMSKAKHLYLLADVKRQAARLGYPLAWPIDVDQPWELPHLAWLYARRKGQEEVLYRALIEARWHRGEPICEPKTLAEVAGQAGLDGAAMVAAEHDPAIRAEAVDAMVAGYEDDVFGIPYFKIGRHRLWGLDRVDDVVAALEATAGTAAPVEPVTADGVPAAVVARIGSYDRDTAGGCG